MSDLRWLLDNVPEDSIEEHALTIEDAIKENEALSNLLSSLVDVELERDVAMSETQRLTKHVEDYEVENAALKRENEAFGDFANTIAYTSDGKRRSSLGLTFTKALEDLKNALLKEQE